MYRLQGLILRLPMAYDTQEFGYAVEARHGSIDARCTDELVDGSRLMVCVGHSLSIVPGNAAGVSVPQRLSIVRHSVDDEAERPNDRSPFGTVRRRNTIGLRPRGQRTS